jgi:hypothetical protein
MLDRRNFIKSIFRNGLLLGLVATGSFLIFKEDNGEACNFDFICKNCKKSKSCALPEAEGYRKNKLKKQRDER